MVNKQAQNKEKDKTSKTKKKKEDDTLHEKFKPKKTITNKTN